MVGTEKTKENFKILSQIVKTKLSDVAYILTPCQIYITLLSKQYKETVTFKISTCMYDERRIFSYEIALSTR